jgi:hypothetical protein
MPDMTAHEAVRATYDPVHDIGTAIYRSPETFARGAEGGWPNPFAFYVAGRGGVLGEVSSDVVASVFGWFNPELVAPLYEEAVGVKGVVAAGQAMVDATAAWGRDHLADVDLTRFVALADRLVDGAEGSGLPLFVAWRRQPRVDDVPGRAAQLFQTLREWRGAVHVVATTAVGLSPLEAILTNEGEGQAKFFGWPEPFPDVSALKDLHPQAEDMTDRLCAKQFEALLSPTERHEFAEGVAAAAQSCLPKK